VSQDESPDTIGVPGEAPPDVPGEAPPDVPGEAPPGADADEAGEWPLPPPVRRAKWPWILGTLSFLLVVASLVASFVQLPYYTIAPGDALNVNTLVTVHGARQYPPKGALMLLFVEERSRINAWRWIQASLDSEIDLVKQKQFAGSADPAEVDAQAVADMANSQDAAKYVALRRLGYTVKVEPRASVVAVIADKPAAGVLRPGDVILTLDGKPIKTAKALTDGMTAVHPGVRVSIGYLRAGFRHTLSIRTANEQGHAVIGVYVTQPLQLPFDVSIETSDIGGPSAGLAMTLSILDELTPGNLTGGKRVAVTGEIGTDGSVLEVGGVGQKAVAARHRGAQLFIVPMAEVAEARTRAGSMPVVGVRTLTDALKALRAAGGDPLPAVRSTRTAA
jgi:PDZ domain-containing protein